MSVIEVEGLEAGYGPVKVLHDLSIHVDDGEIVTVIGSNGAGKTTLLRALSGMIPARGTVRFNGDDISRLSPYRRARRGLAHVPEGRGTIPDLTVHDNLRVGASTVARAEQENAIEQAFQVLPRLDERRDQLAGSLSGGEQQMLALARVFVARPRLILLDEPSMGLSPRITDEVFAELRRMNQDHGTAILMVEQNARKALQLANRAYVLNLGEFVAEGEAAALTDDDAIRTAYLGI